MGVSNFQWVCVKFKLIITVWRSVSPVPGSKDEDSTLIAEQHACIV